MKIFAGAKRSLHALIFFWTAIVSSASIEAQTSLLKDGVHTGIPVFDKNRWQLNNKEFAFREIVALYFSHEAPPLQLRQAIILDDGTLLTGVLKTIQGEHATIHATTLEQTFVLERAALAGALFSGNTPERNEVIPEWPVHRYVDLRASLHTQQVFVIPPRQNLPGKAYDASFLPGRHDRITYLNRDRYRGKLVGLGEIYAAVEREVGELVTPERTLLKLVEFEIPKVNKTISRSDEIFVRLKRGDVLRGKAVQLDGQSLSLDTIRLGVLKIPMQKLALVFPTEAAGPVWLSGMETERVTYAPYFDEHYYPRRNSTSTGEALRLGAYSCDLGLATCPETVLLFKRSWSAGARFVALLGPAPLFPSAAGASIRILADDKVLWHSAIRSGQNPEYLSLPLPEAEELKLEIGFLKDRIPGEVLWGWSAILK